MSVAASSTLTTSVPSSRHQRQVSNLEATIEALFSLAAPSQALKWKLDQLESVIVDLPEEMLQKEWRSKMAKLWAQFAALKVQVPSSQVQEEQVDTSPNWNVFQASGTSRLVSSASCKASHGKPVLSKEAIFTQLEQAFATLPPVSTVDDIDGLERVLTLVATGDKLISTDHYWRDDALQDSLLALALPKLPPSMRQQFIDQFDCGLYRKTLWALDDFLKDKIVKHYEQQRLDKGDRASGSGPIDSDENGSEPLDGCRYCKSSDHDKDQCPKIAAQIW